jgi:hypothetical protein
MSSWGQAPKCPNFFISNWLFVILASPLPRPPSSLGGCSASCPQGSSEGCSAGNPVMNPASSPACCLVSYSASSLERNSASCPASCGDRCSAGHSADCRDSRRERNPESNRASNSVSCLEDSWEDRSPGRLPCSPAGGVYRSCCHVEDCPRRLGQTAGRKPSGLFGQDDLADGLRLVA